MSKSRRPGPGQQTLDIPGWTAGARAVILWSIKIHGKTGPRHAWAIAAAAALDAGEQLPDFPRPYLADLGASRAETARRIYAAAA
jgi:hypothetical protein